jgi:ribosomal protein L11 methyltransferase
MDAWALHTEIDLDAVNLHLGELEAAGLLGIVEEGGRATAYFRHRVEGLPLAGRWEPVPDVDWHAAWRERLEPVRVGPLVIAPPWKASPGPGVIVLEPGQAFGTGHHETTTGCLAALCELDLRHRTILDVGTGTGILAIAAARLGAAGVVAVDVDPLAVEAARDAVGRNGVDVLVVEGSLDVAPGGRFDVVLANLDTSTLAALATGLVARLRPGGTLIASGVSIEREREAVEAFSAAGLPVLSRRGREWVVLSGRR